MTRAVHNVLNRFIPSRVREVLRRSALLTIPSMRHLDMGFRLANLAGQGFTPRVIHDIGASSGDWAEWRRACGRTHNHGFEPNVREKESLD